MLVHMLMLMLMRKDILDEVLVLGATRLALRAAAFAAFNSAGRPN
jgi:hypothetical protein